MIILHPDTPTVGFDDHFAESKSQPYLGESLLFHLDNLEFVKDALAVIQGDSGAFVQNAEAQMRRPTMIDWIFHPKDDAAVGWGKLQGVRKQIIQHPAPQMDIQPHPPGICRRIET